MQELTLSSGITFVFVFSVELITWCHNDDCKCNMIMLVVPMVRPVWRVNCLIKMLPPTGLILVGFLCHRQGTVLVGDLRSRFDAVTGREEVL